MLRRRRSAAAVILALVLGVACRHDGSGRARARANRAPSAQLTVSGERQVGVPLTLDGRRSSDPDGDPLAVEWTLAVKPPASAMTGESLAASAPLLASMTADAAGSYKIRLAVNDGQLSATSSARVFVRADGAGGPGDDEDGVELICPSRGYVAGGELVRLFGGPFLEGTQVRFGARLGTGVRILEEGTVLSVLTPAAGAPGIVDVTVETLGDQARLIPQAFTYLSAPPAFDPGDALDVRLEEAPTALAGLGTGSLLAGLPRGRLSFVAWAGGGFVASPALQAAGAADPIVELAPGPPAADGSGVALAIADDRDRVQVVRAGPGGALAWSNLPFEGQAVTAVLADFEPGGELEAAVADRRRSRLLLYHRVPTSAGPSYLPFGEYPIAGRPCSLAAVNLDDDAEPEIVVGSFPGPELTIIDASPGDASVADIELDALEGIAVVRPLGGAAGGGVELAIIAVESVRRPGDEVHALRLLRLAPAASGGLPAIELAPAPRFSVQAGSGRCETADLDGDGDVDIVLFDDSADGIRILRNTARGEPETEAECDELAATGAATAPPRFRIVPVEAFESAGVQALAIADADADGQLDIAASNARELRGVRVLVRPAGK